MKWSNLDTGRCPGEECGEILKQEQRKVSCDYCTFSMRMSKYLLLIGGKNSKSYQKKKETWARLKQYNKNKKARIKTSTVADMSEKVSNLNRMLLKGEITQEYFDNKLTKIKSVLK